MEKRMWRIIKIISIGILTVSTITGILAFIHDRLEPESKTHRPFGAYERYIKRPLDAFLSMGAIIVFSPIIIGIAFLVRINLGSPVFFKQERPGKDGKIFTLYKFRTMLPAKNNVIDPSKDSDRMTPFGKKLRASSLDELPELINIIKGDMAVVGPRPLLSQYLERYNKHQARRHEVRPGFTGLAQIHGRNSISWNEKFEWDIQYVDNISFINDFRIIIQTLGKVFKHEGINAVGEATMNEFMGNDKG